MGNPRCAAHKLWRMASGRSQHKPRRRRREPKSVLRMNGNGTGQEGDDVGDGGEDTTNDLAERDPDEWSAAPRGIGLRKRELGAAGPRRGRAEDGEEKVESFDWAAVAPEERKGERRGLDATAAGRRRGWVRTQARRWRSRGTGWREVRSTMLEAVSAAAAGAEKGRRRGSCVEAGGELVGVVDKKADGAQPLDPRAKVGAGELNQRHGWADRLTGGECGCGGRWTDMGCMDATSGTSGVSEMRVAKNVGRQARCWGSTSNVVSLGASVPDVLADEKALASEGMDYQVGIDTGCWL
ncbi:hypothetical protein DFH09DRAFT_1076410 [Mycena vulgaris]|nr:hypothetical protein DFH09DRAFT_1076410 [Mycena vulgaris]